MKTFIKQNPMIALFMAAILALAVSAIFFINTPIVDANQSEYCGPNRTAAATTTKTYMTAGTATTTLTITNCSDGSTGLDGAFMAVQVVSSSTPPSLRARVEVSRDGVDWYPYPVIATGNASTSLMTTGTNDYGWNGMASSTDMAGTGNATDGTFSGSRFHQSLALPGTPFPYLRVKFYVPVGAPAIALYAEVLVEREKLAR